MLPKGEKKKILKLLNSKHFIERLDALHELKDAGEHAAFAVSKLTNLIQKDPDDLVIINALDILAVLSSASPELVSVIETASTSERMGVRKKAEKLLNQIGPVEEISAPDVEEPPLTDEHFEKVEETITEIPVSQEAVPAPLESTADVSFDLEEFSVGEIAELKSVETVGIDPVNGVLAQSIPTVPKAIPTPPPEPEPEEIVEEIEEPEEAVEEVIEEIEEAPIEEIEEVVEEAPIEEIEEVDEGIKLLDLKDAPIENSLKNLLMLTQNLSAVDKKDTEARNEIQTLISNVIDELTDHLHILMG
ncbi:MAG: hypothetical protein ACW96U_13780, partial [Candidatus Heimdallarchaeaceae archaeon]